MHAVVSKVVDLPRDRLFDWWTDYEPDDHATGRFRLPGVRDERDVLQRSPHEVVYREHGSVVGIPFEERTRVRIEPPSEVLARSESSVGAYDAVFRFEALPLGATRVTYALDVPPGQGIGKVPAPILAPAARLAMRLDLAWHLRQAERDLRGGANA
jgi:hypothetical protein